MNSNCSGIRLSRHDGLQAAKGLVQIVEALSKDGKIVLENMTVRHGRKRIKLGATEYFHLALTALDECLDLHRPDPSAAVRERY